MGVTGWGDRSEGDKGGVTWCSRVTGVGEGDGGADGIG